MDKALPLLLLAVIIIMVQFFWPWEHMATSQPVTDIAGHVLKSLSPIVYAAFLIILVIVLIHRVLFR